MSNFDTLPQAHYMLPMDSVSKESTEEISTAEWKSVNDLIDEVVQDQNRELFVKSLVEWHLAARQFRKVELRRLIISEPHEVDLRFHAICLHSLLAMGEALDLWSRSFSTEKLAETNIAHHDIKACVESLKQSYREWHHGFSENELEKARVAIFGAAA